MTRYIPVFHWHGGIQRFLDEIIKEKPLLNVCSGTTSWGDVTVDRYEPANVRADWIHLPFKNDSFGAVFADPPWNAYYKKDSSLFVNEALRIAPVIYLMSPWIYGSHHVEMTACWVRQIPGVNQAILLVRYERSKI